MLRYPNRRYLYLCCIISLAALTAALVGAGAFALTAPRSVSGSPRLRLGDDAELSVVIGASEAVVSHRFYITNPISETIRIVDYSASCGCTSVVLSGKTIAPGGTVVLDVQARVQRPDRPSTRTLTVALETSSPQFASAQFSLTVRAFPQVAVEATSLNVGRVQPSSRLSIPVDFDVYTVPPSVAADWSAPKLIGDGTAEFELAVVGDPSIDDLGTGVIRTRWHVLLKGDSGSTPGAHRLRLPAGIVGGSQDPVGLNISWRNTSPVYASPDHLFVGNLDEWSVSGTCGFKLTSWNGLSFRVRDISTNHPAVSCDVVSSSGDRAPTMETDRQVFAVSIDPTKIVQSTLSALVTVEAEHKGGTSLVPVRVTGFRVLRNTN